MSKDMKIFESDWKQNKSEFRSRCRVLLASMLKSGIDKKTISSKMSEVPIPPGSETVSIRHDQIEDFLWFLGGPQPRHEKLADENFEGKSPRKFGHKFGYALLNATSKILMDSPKRAEDIEAVSSDLKTKSGLPQGTLGEQEVRLLTLKRSLVDHLKEIADENNRPKKDAIPEKIWLAMAYQGYRDMWCLSRAVLDAFMRDKDGFNIDEFLDEFDPREWVKGRYDLWIKSVSNRRK